MVEEELSQISAGEFEAVSQLLASSESLQLSFIIMIIGIIGIVFGYTKVLKMGWFTQILLS